jgi:hypothetical protein
MVEHLVVAQKAVGSSPISHPYRNVTQGRSHFFMRFTFLEAKLGASHFGPDSVSRKVLFFDDSSLLLACDQKTPDFWADWSHVDNPPDFE